jgi:hypothetical protein
MEEHGDEVALRFELPPEVFATGLWYTTGNLCGDRTIAYGELMSVKVTYSGEGRL